jgi:hypothetical protein
LRSADAPLPMVRLAVDFSGMSHDNSHFAGAAAAAVTDGLIIERAVAFLQVSTGFGVVPRGEIAFRI